LKSPNKHH
jgi:hypothetical protein